MGDLKRGWSSIGYFFRKDSSHVAEHIPVFSTPFEPLFHLLLPSFPYTCSTSHKKGRS